MNSGLNISDPRAIAMLEKRSIPARLFRLSLGLVCLGLMVFAAPAWVQAAEAFRIGDIKVDVTADSAAEARDQALLEAEQRAFRLLLERITLQADWPRLPVLTAEDIATYIRDFSVSDEKTSAVRYIADLSFQFKDEDLRTLLSELRIPFAETISKPVLVLPIYQSAGAQLLWDEPNPWRQAWNERSDKPGLVPMLLPFGDLEDIGLIGAEQAIAGDASRLQAIARRYAAGDTMVAQAIRRIDPGTGLTILEVYVTRFGSALQEQTLVKSFEAAPDETLDALLARAAIEIALEIEDNWKRDNLIQAGFENVVAVTAKIDGLKSWLAMRQRLSDVAVIRDVDVRLISRSEVRMNIHFTGAAEQLALAMEQADLGLFSAGATWVLTPEPAR